MRSEWSSSRHTAVFLHTDMNKVFFSSPEDLGVTSIGEAVLLGGVDE